MSLEHENIIPEGGNDVPANIKDIYEEGIREDIELHEWNKKRKGYFHGTQLEILRSHTGRFGNAFELMLDEEHESEIKEVIGEDNWRLFSEIAEPFLQSEETTDQLHKLIEIIGQVAEAPKLQVYIRRGLDENTVQPAN